MITVQGWHHPRRDVAAGVHASRLAALVPRPRLHLIRFHGVLAPNAKLRPAIVPRPTLAPGIALGLHSPHRAIRLNFSRRRPAHGPIIPAKAQRLRAYPVD